MEQRRALAITVIASLIILAIIAGVIFYLIRFFQTRQSATSSTPRPTVVVASPTPTINVTQKPGSVASAIPSASAAPIVTTPNAKVYNGPGFSLNVPKNWGILSCSNSQHIELDPSNPADQRIACDIALKPITILVGGNAGCQGETVKLGSVTVVRSKTPTQTGINYRWCTQTTPALDITHRVSSNPSFRATSAQDFSAAIEQMISNMHLGSSS